MNDLLKIIQGDALSELKKLSDKSIQCCVTSPPYYGLRDYKVNGQLGLEASPSEYVSKLVSIFQEVRRVLRDDGTVWLNLGDSYAGSWGDSGHRPERTGIAGHQRHKNTGWFKRVGHPQTDAPPTAKVVGLKPKDLNMEREEQCTGMRNKRDVWTVSPANYPEAHFATFPAKLIQPCILAGTEPGDKILDPFAGSGTTGMVAIELGRKGILIELNPKYIELIKQRTAITPGFQYL